MGPVGLDVNSTGQSDPVDWSGPVGLQITIEQSVLLGRKTVETENTPVDPGDLNMNSARRGELVCRPGIVGFQNRTERSVSPEVRADQVGHVPTSPVDPEVLWQRNQSFADGPVGQDGTEWMHAENDADRPTAGGPVAQLFNSDPLCPSGMPFLDELYQPLAVGPVGQPFITGLLGKHVSEPDCRRTNRIYSGPGGSTGVLDAVIQTGSDVQTDRLSIGTTNGPASSGNTPPSSHSGVHSWKEQWENMSENLTDGASGQTISKDCGSSRRVHMLEIRAPPNTEEEGDSDYPWTDRLLSRKLDGSSSEAVYGEDGRVLYSAVTGCRSDRSADIAALSDFSDDSEETGVRRLLGCQVPITVQPILVTDDVIPKPWDQPVDHERGRILESKVKMSDEEMYNRRYQPIKSSLLQMG